MAPFYRTLLAAGFGGQGVMVLGQLIAYTGIAQGLHVTWIPSYGPEMRGGTANCGVVLSEEEIASPVVSEADAVVIMNQPSLAKFEHAAKKGGILIYNSDLVKYEHPRTDVTVIAVPMNSLAEKLGSDKVAHIVGLGALVEATDLVKEDACIETIKEKLGTKKPKFLPMNLEAFSQGKAVVQGQKKG